MPIDVYPSLTTPLLQPFLNSRPLTSWTAPGSLAAFSLQLLRLLLVFLLQLLCLLLVLLLHLLLLGVIRLLFIQIQVLLVLLLLELVSFLLLLRDLLFLLLLVFLILLRIARVSSLRARVEDREDGLPSFGRCCFLNLPDWLVYKIHLPLWPVQRHGH